MSGSNLPATIDQSDASPVRSANLARGIDPIVVAIDTLKAVRTFVANELRPNVDYGVIPGTGDKPALLKAGAEKIALYYQTRVEYRLERVELPECGPGHMEVRVQCDMVQRQTGSLVASGHGSCTTMESKYRWRKAERQCPECGQPAVIAGRAEYGGGWLCFKKRGGCGAKFPPGAKAIESQQVGRVPNEDIWDQRNTVTKIAMKRALVSAVLSLGSLSEQFTQDVDDIYDLPPEPAPPSVTPPQPAAKADGPASGHVITEIEDRCRAVEARFAKEHPDALPVSINRHRVERGVVKDLTGKSTETLKANTVRAKLAELAEARWAEVSDRVWVRIREQYEAAKEVVRLASEAAVGQSAPDDEPLGDGAVDADYDDGLDGTEAGLSG